MTPSLDVVVPASLDGERVDRALSLLTGMPRSRARQVVDAGSVSVDGRTVATASTALRQGQRLWADVPVEPERRAVADSSVVFAVCYEDDDLVVVDKPAGLVVHHGAGHRGGTLVDGLLARYPELSALAEVGADPERPGLVHRLDKGTSGLLVVARSPAAYRSLTRQMREHTAERSYRALVVGMVADDEAVVDAPIGRSARRPDRMSVQAQGRPARTRYSVLARYGAPQAATLLDVGLETGRTHQVRVHMSAVGHPVVGDDRYGDAPRRAPELHRIVAPGRLFLHAWRLSVDRPDGERLTVESALPDDLVKVLAGLS